MHELTVELFRRLLAGELDVAAVLLPEGRTAPPPLLTNIIASDRMEIVQGAAGNLDGDWKSLGKAPWVLNPPGCPLRASLIDRMDRDGFTPMIAAEIHNMHLHLAFVQSGYGVGLLPARVPQRLTCTRPSRSCGLGNSAPWTGPLDCWKTAFGICLR